MALLHDMDRRHWPADLPDRIDLVFVFQAYGGSSHIAAVWNRDVSAQLYEVWARCLTCGWQRTEQVDTSTRQGRDRAMSVCDAVSAFADRHVDQTRRR